MDDLTPIDPNQLSNLVPRSQDGLTTTQKSNASLPQWVLVIQQMAQDKRHDLAPGILLYWKGKLENYRDPEICEALRLYTGQFFPSVDDILRDMDRMRERRWEEKQAQPPKEEPGKVPATQADWDEMKRKAREIFAKADKSNDLQLTERNRKAQAQSRVLGCESK